jgi:hypothetical protein
MSPAQEASKFNVQVNRAQGFIFEPHAPVTQNFITLPKEPSISYWLGRPAPIWEGFVGREAELQAIGDAFKDLNKKAVVISGGAGTGKSRLAAEFSYRSRLEGFWTTAGASRAQTLTALAHSVDVPVGEATDEEIVVAVQKRLLELTLKPSG